MSDFEKQRDRAPAGSIPDVLGMFVSEVRFYRDVSSVPADRWTEVIAAYGPEPRLNEVLPSAAVQGLLSLADHSEGSPAALERVARLAAAAEQLQTLS